ncbi:sugar ABC transporter ATP-binding protein [Ruixingdingia sedimenti]|uniref:Sugar ABC transporter ATP-binding protein n=1 Tax=Ruixingdingia sedimenti TaxID=3073604 RepID=A0ABU1F6C3_9RHOB|nr:sugar ABC transporter ATP-binding protein [Xinfangfangia sp. LG-4]MDR5652426.1 sugar ABC transporter ATP-binding protein [Xinfangfangia sp. LG-4]
MTAAAAPLAVPAGPALAVSEAVPTLAVEGLTKLYGQHAALDDVSLRFMPGEVHVLFGENGAGKSTLISMIAGANTPTSGTILMQGRPVEFESVRQARAAGVRAVFQEFSLVPDLTVAENITLGEEPVAGLRRLGLAGVLSKSAARAEARRLIDDLGFDLNPDARVCTLTRGKQQMVEICKAMRLRPDLLILDEPTASLSEHDSQALFALIRRLTAAGTAIIYVTHRMHEIPLIGTRLSVLRDGQFVATVPADTPEDRLIELMTGRSLAKIYPRPRADLGEVVLELSNVTLAPQVGAEPVRNASLTVRAGEIVGIAGLVGCGKGNLAQACFGLHRIVEGEMRLKGRPFRPRHPADAIRKGLWYSPADRKHDGLALELSAHRNMILSGLSFGPSRGEFLRPRRDELRLRDLVQMVDFDARRLSEPVGRFSGGNQQKILLGKALVQDVEVYVFDEPTVGVDIGACLSIYRCLAALSARGAAILVVSSNLPELMGLTHRMLVMSGGSLVAEFDRADYDEHKILEQFF